MKGAHIKNFVKFWNLAPDQPLKCWHCQLKLANDLHHIIFRSQGGSDEVENLIPLCRDCHNAVHLKRKISAEKLLNIVKAYLPS